MEGRSGFKECPRCGLRNRVSAIKCDFCGFEFQDSKEEWSDYVDMLENLSKSEEAPQEDEDLSRRIESTLVKSTEEVAVGKSTIASAEEFPEEAGLEHTPVKEESDVNAFVDSMIDTEIEDEVPLDEFKGDEEEPSGTAPSLEYPEDGEVETEATEEKAEIVETIPVAGIAATISEVEEWEDDLESPTEKESFEAPAEEKPVEDIHQEEPGRIEPIEAEAIAETVEEVAIPEDDLEMAQESQDAVEGVIEEQGTGWDFLEEEPPFEEDLIQEESAAPIDETPEEMAESDAIVLSDSKIATTLPFIASMGIGAILYLVALAGQLFLSLDVSLQWTLVVVGSLLLLLGFRRFYDVFLPVSETRRGNAGV